MTSHRRAPALLLPFILLSASLTAWQVRDVKPIVIGTATLSGTVMTDETTPTPARRATVTITGDVVGRRGIAAVSDENGRFTFTNLPADRYAVRVSKAGYLEAEYGSKRPGGVGVPVPVADGAHLDGLSLKLLRGCVLSGTVFDENGQPVSGVSVAALRYATSPFSGERTLQQVDDAEATTDDRGMYRIYGLRPGDYMVAAGLPTLDSSRTASDIRQITTDDIQRAQQLLRASASAPSAAAVSAPTLPHGPAVDFAGGYHPAALSPLDAVTITLGPREERAGINVIVRLVPTTKVEGIASTPDGKPVANATLYIMNPAPPPTGYFAMTLRSARTDPNGRFSFGSVPAGRYTIATETVDLGIVTEVTIEGRQMTLPLTLSPPVTITGRAKFEGTSPRPAALRDILPMFMAARESPAMRARILQVDPDDTFRYGVFPGSYRLTGFGGRQWRNQPATGWTLKSMVLNGQDVADIRFDVKPGDAPDAVITYTDLRSEISGTVLNTAGAAAPQYVLVVYSADQRHWIPSSRRTQEVRAGVDGRFVVRNLPPGDYFISAVDDIEPGESNDAAFLAGLAAHQPIRVSLGPGEKKVQDIRVLASPSTR